jgi:hypothetical protein
MKWTDQKISQLRELAMSGKSNKEIADTLHCKITDVYAKRSKLGITIPQVAAMKNIWK